MRKLLNELRRISVQIRPVLTNRDGSSTIQFALVAAGVAIVAALAIPPALEKNIDQIALRTQNIDTRITGSISQKRRYTIRKSITTMDN